MIGRSHTHRIGWSIIAAACIAVFVLDGSALGQGGGGGGGDRFRGMGPMGGFAQDMFTPGVDRRDLERYESILQLTREQQDTVRALFEGYNEEFRAAASKAREKMDAAREAARESGDRSAFQGMRGMFQELRTQRNAMEQAFFTDVQAVLTPQQQERWPVVERVRRRERTVQRGLMSGERVDVIRIVEGQKLPADTKAALGPVLEQYEAELDKALIDRNKVYDEGLARMGDLFDREDRDAARAEAQKQMDTARQASVRVRDINRRYARQVQQMLPEAAQWEFEREVKRASFPFVYREARVSRELSAAKGFGDLDEGQREGLAALNESYQRDFAALNDQLARATEEAEETITADRVFRARRDEMDDGPAGDLWRKRRELERATGESLRKLLRPEQVERLPKPERDEPNDDGPRRFRRQAEDGGEGDARPQRGGGGR